MTIDHKDFERKLSTRKGDCPDTCNNLPNSRTVRNLWSSKTKVQTLSDIGKTKF